MDDRACGMSAMRGATLSKSKVKSASSRDRWMRFIYPM
jgi:hypothetical protein